jgi:type II secretory pathway pseudopilin PulG
MKNFGFTISDFGLKRHAGARSIHNPQSAIRNAFTLTEILIVIGIIVLMHALAVPAFNFITGSRSHNGAENIISAMLGRARAYAIQNQVEAGVVFFVDPATARTTMAIITRGLSTGGGPEDPYPNYRGWTATSPNPPTGSPPTVYQAGHQVIWPAPDQLPANPGFPNETTLIVQRFTHDNSNTSPTPAPGQPNSPWTGGGGSYVDILTDSEFQALPPGVGCQLINDPKGAPNTDRYVRTGAIMFDAQGRVESADLGFSPISAIGTRLRLVGNQPAAGVFKSQLGIVLYDQAAFADKGFTDADAALSIGEFSPPQVAGGPGSAEATEETWLDQNASPLYLDRYNGTVLKGE